MTEILVTLGMQWGADCRSYLGVPSICFMPNVAESRNQYFKTFLLLLMAKICRQVEALKSCIKSSQNLQRRQLWEKCFTVLISRSCTALANDNQFARISCTNQDNLRSRIVSKSQPMEHLNHKMFCNVTKSQCDQLLELIVAQIFQSIPKR